MKASQRTTRTAGGVVDGRRVNRKDILNRKSKGRRASRTSAERDGRRQTRDARFMCVVVLLEVVDCTWKRQNHSLSYRA